MRAGCATRASQAAYRCGGSTGCAGAPLPVSRWAGRANARPGTERAHTIAQRVPPPAARVPGTGDGGPRAPR
ncbi:conserved hypothetical protein [Burkholderia pseudomallei MSHR346]|nr:conserved hypothetical protein [Burkholderia pseudomallei MSHR346]